MTLTHFGWPLRVLVLTWFLLALGPVQAQQEQGSDVSGAIPQSDVSGAVPQSEQALFPSAITRSQLSIAEGLLEQMLQQRYPAPGLDGNRNSVSPRVATVLMADGKSEVQQARNQVARALTERGMPNSSAQALVQAASGLLSESEVPPDQFVQALRAFNAAVDEAPEEFRAHPPREFVDLRVVLATLLWAASG